MMYSLLLVLALAAQGYARPNCFFACDYPMGQAPVQPGFGVPSGNPMQPGYPPQSGSMVQQGYPVSSNVEVFRPSYQPGSPSHVESFQPTGSHVNFNHESQASQKTSISGTYTYAAPSPPVQEPYNMPYKPAQKPCHVYSDCY